MLVVDRESRDETLKRVEASGVAHVIKAQACSRANQMFTGTEAAGGTILLFLHADCKRPDECVSHVCGAERDLIIGQVKV